MIRKLPCALFFVALIPAPAAHAQETWMLLSRESGCVSVQRLVKMERLPHAPSSPEE